MPTANRQVRVQEPKPLSQRHLDALATLVCKVRSSQTTRALARAAVERLEREPGFGDTRFGRLLGGLHLSEGASWFVRIAAGARVANACGRRRSPGVTLASLAALVSDVSLGLGERALGAAADHGIVIADPEPDNVREWCLAPGLEEWLEGQVWPPRKDAAPFWLADSDGIERLARSLNTRLAATTAPFALLHHGPRMLAAAIAERAASLDGRVLVVAGDLRDCAIGAAAFVVGLDGKDVFIEGVFDENDGPPRRVPGPGRLFMFSHVLTPRWTEAARVDLRGHVPMAEAAARAYLVGFGVECDPQEDGDELFARVELFDPLDVPEVASPEAAVGGSAAAAPKVQRFLGRPEVLDELVLAEDTATLLREIAARFASGGRTVVLLQGPSGTGKSHAAKALAAASGRELLTLDPGVVRGMFVGQSERGLSEAFAAARARGAVLFIDEAEGWLPSRMALRADDHRHVEIGCLLTGLDGHDGPVILATNLPHALDAALRRRVDVDVAMNPPGVLERMVLWTRALGAGDDGTVEGIDVFVLSAVGATAPEIARVVADATRRKTRSTRGLFDGARAAVESR